MITRWLLRTRRFLVPTLALFLFSPAAVSPQGASAPTSAWTTVTPGGETSCLHGSEYRFFTHVGDPTKVLLFLMGGGACWDGVSCVTQPSAAQNAPGSMEGWGAGALALDEPDNPFRNHTIVFAPYCSGDVHLGDRDARYQVTLPDGTVRDTTIRHRGMVNGAATLAWIAANVPGAREIVVMGGSAGAIPTPVYGSLLAKRFPRARVVAIGDGGGAFHFAGTMLTGVSWGLPTAIRRLEGWEKFPDVWGVPDFSIIAARVTPKLTLAQVDYAWDQSQGVWSLRLGISTADLPGLLKQNRDKIKAAVPAFRGYTMGGLYHTVAEGSDLFTHGTAGVWVRDWVGDLAAGRPVRDVECITCWRPDMRFRPIDRVFVDSVASLLATPERWSPTDEGSCRAQREQLSLRCAISRSGTLMPQAQAGSQAFFYQALSEMGGKVPPVDLTRQFNPVRILTTRPGTTHGDVVKLIVAVRERVNAEPRL